MQRKKYTTDCNHFKRPNFSTAQPSKKQNSFEYHVTAILAGHRGHFWSFLSKKYGFKLESTLSFEHSRIMILQCKNSRMAILKSGS